MITKALRANWVVPPNVHALTTYRDVGISRAPFDSNNLGMHVGDTPQMVITNRESLISQFDLPTHPCWLDQTHSNKVIIVEQNASRQADAAITRAKHLVLAILTADCVPIVLSNKVGNEIAAIHAGRNGILTGIIENTLEKMISSNKDIIAWVGPHICVNCYEVNHAIFDEFNAQYPFAAEAFKQEEYHIYLNLQKMVELCLKFQGVETIYQANTCTFENNNHFYSYRRSAQTGRIATLIWFN